jgi:hypothetical protein
MRRSIAVAIAGCMVLAAGSAAASVKGDLGVEARSLDPAGLATDRAFILTPDLSVGDPGLFLRGSGLLRTSGSRGLSGDGRLETGVSRPLFGAWTIELDAQGGSRTYPGRPRSERYEAGARLRAAAGAASGYAGVAALRARNDRLWSTSRLLTAGGALRFGRFELGLDQRTTLGHRTIISTRDTLVLFPDSTYHRVRITDRRRTGTGYTDAGLHLGWERGRWSTEARFGLRLGDFGRDTRVWALVTGGYRLTRNLGLALRAGREPSVPEEGIPAGNVASLGLSFVFAPPPEPVRPEVSARRNGAFSARTVAEGWVLLRVRVPEASRVELMGDFTDWLPVNLSRDEEGRWGAAFPLAPGTYRVCVRVNGGTWTAPPGLTAVRDEFNGTVGILVVR